MKYNLDTRSSQQKVVPGDSLLLMSRFNSCLLRVLGFFFSLFVFVSFSAFVWVANSMLPFYLNNCDPNKTAKLAFVACNLCT